MNTDIYAHFQPEERIFINRVTDWIHDAGQYHELKQTDFLDPRQQFIVQSLVNRHTDIQSVFYGGYEDAERKKACIAPDYRIIEHSDFDMKVLSITSNDTKIANLDHGDFMGAILNIGMKRDKIGDIHVHDGG